MRLITVILIMVGMFYAHAQERGSKPVVQNNRGSKAETYSGSYALLIGNSDYGMGWSKLPGVKKDLELLKKVLEDYHGFTVIVKENLDRQQMDIAFSEFIRDYGRNEKNRLLFYYAGHGHTLSRFGEAHGYLVPLNAVNPSRGDPFEFTSNSLPISRIMEYSRQLNVNHAIFMFDSCFAGTLFNYRGDFVGPPSITYKMSKPIRYFITSGSAEEAVPDQSIFNQELVEALQTNIADLNSDGFLTGTELGLHLTNMVQNYSNGMQNPQTGKIRDNKLDKGDMVFFLNDVVNIEEEQTKIFETQSSHRSYLEIINTVDGKLYINDEFKRNVSANKLITILNLPEGMHDVRIVPDLENTKAINFTFIAEKDKIQSLRTSAKQSSVAGNSGEELLGATNERSVIDLSESYDEIVDQGIDVNALSWAITSAVEYLYRANKIELDPSYLYQRIFQAGDEDGSVEDALIFSKNIGLKQIADPGTNTAYRIKDYEDLPQTVSSVKEHLMSERPLIAEIAMYASTMTLQNGLMTKPGNKEPKYGDHVVLIVGYNNETQLLKFKNSWGDQWGDKGFGYIPYGDWEDLVQKLWSIK